MAAAKRPENAPESYQGFKPVSGRTNEVCVTYRSSREEQRDAMIDPPCQVSEDFLQKRGTYRKESSFRV